MSNPVVVLFSSGEYSDYGVNAIVEWLRPDVTAAQARDIYRATVPTSALDRPHFGWDGSGVDEFLAWLNREGYIRDLECTEIWIGEESVPIKWNEPERRPVPTEDWWNEIKWPREY